MDFKLDENILWIIGILVIIFFLFPQNNAKAVEVEHEGKVEKKVEEKYEYIYRRNNKARRRLI